MVTLMCKNKWYRVINITLALVLTLVLSSSLANFALPRPAFAADTILNKPAASGAPGSALSSAGTNGGLLQFTSAGHVLGFSEDGVIIASARHMLRIDFLNARAVAPEADGTISGESSTSAAPPLGHVTYNNLWDGVTVVYEASEWSIVKSTYYLAATKEGVHADRIRLGYNRPVQIDENGNLLIIYENGTMVEGAPVAWQEIDGQRQPVTTAYVLYGDHEVGFSLGDYAPGIPVVIDPAMTWHTFLGGSGSDVGYGIAVDGSGNVYVAGTSNATWGDNPVRAYIADYDAFAAKLNSSGSLTWNTFLGGTGSDYGRAIAVDGSGNVYVSGYSRATWGAPVRAYTAGSDAFAARLDSSVSLTWNTFLGGTGSDDNYGIAVDGSGNVYVVGSSMATWGDNPVRLYTSGYDASAVKLYYAPKETGGSGDGFSVLSSSEMTLDGPEADVSSGARRPPAPLLVDRHGQFLYTAWLYSDDGRVLLTFRVGVFALTETGLPISEIRLPDVPEFVGQMGELYLVKWEGDPPLPPPPAGAIVLAYNLGPDGATFDPPITLTLEYDPEDLPEGFAEEDLVIAYYDEETGEWVELPSEVDTVTGTITASVSHFTEFAVISMPPPPPPVLAPADFVSSSLSISPVEVDIDQTVTISALVTNIGEEEGSYTITLKINGVVEQTREITLTGGASETVTFSVVEDEAGTYSVDVDGLTGSFTVREVALPPAVPPPPPGINWTIWRPVIIGVAVFLAIFLPIRLRRRRLG